MAATRNLKKGRKEKLGAYARKRVVMRKFLCVGVARKFDRCSQNGVRLSINKSVSQSTLEICENSRFTGPSYAEFTVYHYRKTRSSDKRRKGHIPNNILLVYTVASSFSHTIPWPPYWFLTNLVHSHYWHLRTIIMKQ